jgi:hypothetical protein
LAGEPPDDKVPWYEKLDVCPNEINENANNAMVNAAERSSRLSKVGIFMTSSQIIYLPGLFGISASNSTAVEPAIKGSHPVLQLLWLAGAVARFPQICA